MKNRISTNRCTSVIVSLLLAFTLGACSTGDSEISKSADKQQQSPEQNSEEQVDSIEVTARREHQQGIIHTDRAQLAEIAQQSKIRTRQLGTVASMEVAALTMSDSRYLPPPVQVHQNNETYGDTVQNPVFNTQLQPLSTFSIDVDTGSYSIVRRMLNQGILPPTNAVRVEEFINYFDYPISAPAESQPFSIVSDIAPSPWNPQRHLLRISLKASEAPMSNASVPKNLVFLLDVSGSMDQPNKLPLVKGALDMILSQLTSQDSVAIVVYAGASGVVLEPTPGDQIATIRLALSRLAAGGSTNGEQGIELAYNLAEQNLKQNGVNRVILATDGDFNVGTVDHDALIALIENKRKKGIALTTLGFGQGNYNDRLMEQLADKGNGNYAYIDNINEARKVLVEQFKGTLITVAKDVKIQIEFNPATVAEYRLIGYDNRSLKAEDFNNDKVDSGEIGQGHEITAFYELTLTNSNARFVDELRYQNNSVQTPGTDISGEIAHLKLRYKPLDSETSRLIAQTVVAGQIRPFMQQSQDFKFSTAVVGFAQLLQNSQYSDGVTYADIEQLASLNKGEDEFGYRTEMINLVRTASLLNR